MKKSQTQNTFEQLIMDLHPLETPNTVYTNALNATIITRDGNEGVLQNDMGNGRVETAYLPEGYIPLGTCSLGGIIYVACYNPLTDKGQIGCFPSPERNVSSDEVTDLDVMLSNNDFKWVPDKDKDGEDLNYSTTGAEVYYLKKGLFQEEFTFNPGDKFIVYGNPLSDNFEKLWIEEEYDDFFGKGPEDKLEPFIEDKPNSKDDDYSHVYDGSDEEHIYYYPPEIILEYSDLENNQTNTTLAPTIFKFTQTKIIYDEETGETVRITETIEPKYKNGEWIYDGDKIDVEISWNIDLYTDFNGNIKIEDENINTGQITYTSEDVYLPRDVATIKVTIKMNGKTNSMTTTLSQEGIDPDNIIINSISGNIKYSYGDSESETVSINEQSGELTLYMLDDKKAVFDFSEINANVTLVFSDGTTEAIERKCNINLTKSLGCSYKKPDEQGGEEIMNSSVSENIITLAPNGYGDDINGIHLGDNSDKELIKMDIYRYFESCTDELNEHFITPDDEDLPMWVPFYTAYVAYLEAEYKGRSANLKINIRAIPEKIYHAVGPQGSSENTVHIPYVVTPPENAVRSNVISIRLPSNFSGAELNDNFEDTLEKWIDEELPIVYCGKIKENKLPLSYDYGINSDYITIDSYCISDSETTSEACTRPFFYVGPESTTIQEWQLDNVIVENDDDDDDKNDELKTLGDDDVLVFFNTKISMEETYVKATPSNAYILRFQYTFERGYTYN